MKKMNGIFTSVTWLADKCIVGGVIMTTKTTDNNQNTWNGNICDLTLNITDEKGKNKDTKCNCLWLLNILLGYNLQSLKY